MSIAISNLRTPRRTKTSFRHAPVQPAAPTYATLPPITSLQTRPHPGDPIQNDLQLRMLKGFKVYGRIGLVKEIHAEARARSWSIIIDDLDSGNNYMIQLLTLLPDCIIESLIKNTPPYDSINDSEVRKFVRLYMNMNVEAPGIYVNILTRAVVEYTSKKVISSMIPQHTGKWLTSDEVKTLLTRIEKYLDNHPHDDAENAALDDMWSLTKVKRMVGDRKFKPSIERMKQWLQTMRKEYCDHVPPGEANEQFMRCPFEVGYSQNVKTRCKSHLKNWSTTPIFGLVNAITRQRRSQGGFEFPEPWQLTLFPLWKDDKELARVAECLGSILCSSYWLYGGLNIYEAGVSTLTANTPSYDHILWTQALRDTKKRLNEYQVFDHELFFWQKIISHWTQLIEMQEQESQTAADEAESKRLSGAYQETLSKLRAVRADAQDAKIELTARNRAKEQERSKTASYEVKTIDAVTRSVQEVLQKADDEAIVNTDLRGQPLDDATESEAVKAGMLQMVSQEKESFREAANRYRKEKMGREMEEGRR